MKTLRYHSRSNVAPPSRRLSWRRLAATCDRRPRQSDVRRYWPGGSDCLSAPKNRSRLYERTLGVLIEASSSSSRGPANFGKHPIFMERGSRLAHLRRRWQ